MSQGHSDRRGVRTSEVPSPHDNPTAFLKWIKSTNHALDRTVQEAVHLRNAVVRAWVRMRELIDEDPPTRDIWDRKDLAEITADPLGGSGVWRTVVNATTDTLRMLFTSAAPQHLAEIAALVGGPISRLHIICDARLIAHADMRLTLDNLRNPAVTVRIRQDVPVDMWLADTSVGLVRFMYGEGINGLLAYSPQLLEAYSQLFDKLWTDPLSATCRPPAVGTTSRQHWVIRLLATGMSDAEIANLLGVNIRTVRRHVADAMRELGAVNRAGAGLAAAQRGWV